MIIELILSPILVIIYSIIHLIPVAMTLPDWTLSLLSLLSTGLAFFPTDVWIVSISTISFWAFVQMAWATIEWVYKKIPGVS